MAFKISILLASILVASSLPFPDQSSISDQNMKIGLYSGLISTSLDLPSVNGMDNDIVINQNRNRISGNTKLVVNQIDNEILGNSEIQVNQQGNKIGGKSPILMNIDGNNITGNSSVDVNQQGNQIGLYKKEIGTSPPTPITPAVPKTTTPPIPVTTAVPTTTTSDTTPLIPVTTDVPTTTTSGTICPEGFLTVEKQCFKFFPDQGMTWEDANTLCQNEGLVLGQPDDPAAAVALRKLLVETYAVGVDKLAWLGARGTDSKEVKWIQDGTALSSTSSLWYPGQPGPYAKTENCLELMVRESNLNRNPTQPYIMTGCTGTNKHPLCELTK